MKRKEEKSEVMRGILKIKNKSILFVKDGIELLILSSHILFFTYRKGNYNMIQSCDNLSDENFK